MKGTLGVLVAGAPAISGCSKDYEEGIVKAAYLDGRRIEESSGALFGNESVKLGSKAYVLEIQTSDGVYTAVVNDNYKGSLNALIVATRNPGTKIRFMTRCNLDRRFRKDRIGELSVDEIEVTGRAEAPSK